MPNSQEEFPFFPCAICREHMDHKENNIVKPLLCSHHFHKTCILEMCEQNTQHTNCPICRKPMYKFILLAKDGDGNPNFKFYNKTGRECKSAYELKWSACNICFTTAFSDNMKKCSKCVHYWHAFCGSSEDYKNENGGILCHRCAKQHAEATLRNRQESIKSCLEYSREMQARRAAIREARKHQTNHHSFVTRSKAASGGQQQATRRTRNQNNQNVAGTRSGKRQVAAPQANQPSDVGTSSRTRQASASQQNQTTKRTTRQTKVEKSRQYAAPQQKQQPSTKRSRKQ
ncbi:unnamed protein product [Caenorhabditis angaria]|uniref:RING-type domain-containing protein n=1 Tax=Caenorhabditis angaria TaxID=860376 RepID=A0A9P1J0C5_9PELO|nr:unnamed protein product [Caenorhabditis angaria]